MNAKTMAVVLDRTEQSTRTIAELKRLLQESNNSFMRLQALVGCGHLDKEQTEAAIKSMMVEHKKLAITEREHAALISSLDEVPLGQDDGESYAAYALRVGDAMRALKDDKSTLQKDLHESRLENERNLSVAKGLQQIVATRDAQIAQINESASSLASALTLLGTMHDGELANEFVSRMSDEKKRVTLQLDLIAKVIEQLPDSMRMQYGETYEPFLRRIQKSYVANEETIARHEATIESLKNRDAELLALYDVIENLRGLPMQPDEKYSEYLKRMAAEVDQLRAQLDAATRRLLNAQGENEILTSQRQLVEGELSLHQQVIARLMMQPGTDKVFDLDWNASARKVLIDARALCGDTAEANVVTKEPA